MPRRSVAFVSAKSCSLLTAPHKSPGFRIIQPVDTAQGAAHLSCKGEGRHSPSRSVGGHSLAFAISVDRARKVEERSNQTHGGDPSDRFQLVVMEVSMMSARVERKTGNQPTCITQPGFAVNSSPVARKSSDEAPNEGLDRPTK
jgi:hypothetical protein